MRSTSLIASSSLLALVMASPAFAVDVATTELAGDPTARLQVIHNAADPAAAVVDVYLGETLALDDFAFRTATPYIDVPAGVEVAIGIAPGNSETAADAIAVIPVTFAENETYVAVANGVLAPMDFVANPEGRSTAFQLLLKTGAREAAMDAASVEFFALHGATDAPRVDVIARDVATLVSGAAYTDITGYVPVPAAAYTLDVTPAGMPSTIVASYGLDVSGLAGRSAVVFASGFFTPTGNNNGEAFGLFVALGDGTVLELPAAPAPPMGTARLQVIHNAADPAARKVDIYLNGERALNNFEFRTATPYIDVPAGVEIEIAVAGPKSDSADEALAVIPVTFEAGETYVAIANGVLDPSAFAANPEGRSTGFQLLLKSGARETSSDRESIDFFVVHGATDAPTVDVIARDVATIVDDATYTDITDYISVNASRYILDVTPGSDNDTVVASLIANLGPGQGRSAVIFASGFFDPSANNGGEAFGIFAAGPGGRVYKLRPAKDDASMARTGAAALAPTVSLTPAVEFGLAAPRPNPAVGPATISFALDRETNVRLAVFDIRGRLVETLRSGRFAAGSYDVAIDASRLSAGVYLYRLEAGPRSETRKLIVTR